MGKKDIQKYLQDVLLAIDNIEKIAIHFKLKDFDNIPTKWAIERGISIIGEALYKANNLNRTLAITNITKIIATRHIVIHDYDIIDDARLLAIVNIHLPILKQEVKTILNNS